MKKFNEVRQLHLEISSRCNARCPSCRRNFFGFPHNHGYEETDMSLAVFKTKIQSDMLQQIEEIWFNGNLGDFIMNNQGTDIIKYILDVNNKIDINISTNGSARNSAYWRTLGETGVKIWFCLDGLEDTHSLYRQDTNFKTILKNAKTFMKSGGKAVWHYTVFEHNKHQIDMARNLAKQLGFTDFVTRNNNRSTITVYNRKGFKINVIDGSNSDLPDRISEEFLTNKKQIMFKQQKALFEVKPNNTVRINCESLRMKSLYMNTKGTFFPCCYLDLFLNRHNNEGISSIELDKEYFPSVKNTWESNPIFACSKFCGNVQT